MIELGVNSWVEVADADAYFATVLNTDAWDDATGDLPEQALVSAFWRLMQIRGVQKVDHDDPPDNLKRAQMKLALVMLREDLIADTGLEPFSELRVGPVAMKMRSRAAGTLPDDVRRELGDLISGSPFQFPILRG